MFNPVGNEGEAVQDDNALPDRLGLKVDIEVF